MDDAARAFGWTEWPFRIVADAKFARLWADRAGVREEIERRLRRLRAIPHSTVQVIWADFGAGKSHTLRYLEARCLDAGDGKLVPLYTEVAVGTTGLIDLYRGLASSISEELLSELGADTEPGSKSAARTGGARDLRHALRILASNDVSGRALVLEWFQATPGTPHLRALKAYGIGARIEDDGRAVEVLTELIRLIRELRGGAGIVWLIDEFQRVADVPQRKRDAFAKSIVTLYNACPAGLHFVLSFSVAQVATATALLPPDLRSRAATFPMLTLPFLDHDACEEFCRDLFAAFREAPSESREFPLLPGALTAVLGEIDRRASGTITPRTLMEGVEAVLFEIYDRSGGHPSLPLEAATVAKAIASLRERQDEST